MISECYLDCGHNKNVIEFLQSQSNTPTFPNLNLSSQSQLYFYQARAWQSLQNYSKAIININAALKKEPNNDKYITECSKIKILKNYHETTPLDHFRKANNIYDEETYNLRHSSSNQSYDILSIDGGGIRSIIPAVVLCELER